MFELEKSVVFDRNGDVEWAQGKVAVRGISMSVFSFYVDGLLIDTGSNSLANEFQSFFNKITIQQVALTHVHEDHAGNVAWIQQHQDVPIYVHPDAVNLCAKVGEYPFYRKVLWGERPAFVAQPLGSTLQTNQATWDVIATPGHTTDHVAFYNRSTGAMFTGDLYVQSKTKVVLDEENIVHTLASLQHLLNYDFEAVYCAHAGFLVDGRAKVIEKITYLEELKLAVRKLYDQGYSMEEITKVIFPRDYPITQVSGEQWSSKHIIQAFIQHFSKESLR